MKRSIQFLALSVVLAGVGSVAEAQSCSIASTSNSVNCTVATTLSTTMSSLMNLTLNGTTVTLGAPSAVTDFDGSGLFSSTTAGPNFQVKANRSYRVQVSTDAATFSHTPATGAASYAKPVANVQVSTDGANFSALSTVAADVASGSATASSTMTAVTYRTAYDITKDQPGNYTLGVTFTLIAP